MERKRTAILTMTPLDDHPHVDKPREAALNRCNRADAEQVKDLQRQRLLAQGIVITNVRCDIAILDCLDKRQMMPLEPDDLPQVVEYLHVSASWPFRSEWQALSFILLIVISVPQVIAFQANLRNLDARNGIFIKMSCISPDAGLIWIK